MPTVSCVFKLPYEHAVLNWKKRHYFIKSLFILWLVCVLQGRRKAPKSVYLSEWVQSWMGLPLPLLMGTSPVWACCNPCWVKWRQTWIPWILILWQHQCRLQNTTRKKASLDSPWPWCPYWDAWCTSSNRYSSVNSCLNLPLPLDFIYTWSNKERYCFLSAHAYSVYITLLLWHLTLLH